jgi:hypothetical protein
MNQLPNVPSLKNLKKRNFWKLFYEPVTVAVMHLKMASKRAQEVYIPRKSP